MYRAHLKCLNLVDGEAFELYAQHPVELPVGGIPYWDTVVQYVKCGRWNRTEWNVEWNKESLSKLISYTQGGPRISTCRKFCICHKVYNRVEFGFSFKVPTLTQGDLEAQRR